MRRFLQKRPVLSGLLSLVFWAATNVTLNPAHSSVNGLFGTENCQPVSPACFAETRQIEVVPYRNVSPQKLKNVADAVAVTETLLVETGFALSEPVKVVVTENETDYAGAIAEYEGIGLKAANKKAEISTGLSLSAKPVILLDAGRSGVEKYPASAYALLPHEIFHQAQKHDGITGRNTPAWFLEGSAEAFRYLALERAGIHKRGASFQDTFNRLTVNYMYKGKKELPPLSSLTSYNDWEAALKTESNSGPPLLTAYIYSYAALAVLRLTGGDFSRMAEFHRLTRAGETFDQAFPQVFGKSAAKFEEELTDSLNEEIKKFAAEKYGAAAGNASKPKTAFGIHVRPVNADDLKTLGLPTSAGLLVTAVDKDSPAEELGLRANDALLAVNGVTIQNINQLKEVLAAGEVKSAKVFRNGAEALLEAAESL